MNLMNSTTRILALLLTIVVGNGLADDTDESSNRSATASCGIADIDMIRARVVSEPTNPSNAKSRRAALYRWWRLLWHQGYDMNTNDYATTWEKVLSSSGEAGFRALDQASGVQP